MKKAFVGIYFTDSLIVAISLVGYPQDPSLSMRLISSFDASRRYSCVLE